MKSSKRVLSMALALVMCVSMLSGLVFSADAVQIQYTTGNPTPVGTGDDAYTGVIANWGQRGTNATYLSDNAINFYAGTSYDALSQLTDTTTATEYNDNLYTALQNLMVSAHSVKTDYDSTRALYAYTDCQNSDISSISSFYSGMAIGPAWDQGTTWNREHTWPNSKDLNGEDEDDIMMLRPTSSDENSGRNNNAYGESSGYYDPNKASNGTYNLHGDVARIMLYVYVRWGNTEKMWGESGVIESMDVLLKWMREDPVDTWELGRNDSVQSITGTRNVFVDYPELAFLLFDQAVPNMVTPSGVAAAQDNTYTVTAVSADTSKGTVACYGDTITAFPATGYKAAGYEVTSGSAEVVQNGNLFTVTAGSDCTVTISFVSNSAYSINFTEAGTAAPSLTAYAGDEITLPALTNAAPQGYTFLGWVDSTVNHVYSKPATIYTPGEKYALTGDTSFYALYVYTEAAEAGQGNVFEKNTGAVTSGDYLIVSDGAAMKTAVSSNRFQLETGIITLGEKITNAADTSIWKFESVSDNTFTFYNSANAVYAAGSGTKNQGKLLTSVTDYAKWQITNNADPYTIENVGNRTKNVNYTLRRNANYGFATYAANTGTGISLYKLIDEKAVYTTTSGCPHRNTELRGATAASCTAAGYTGDLWCFDCTTVASAGTAILATGHAGATWVAKVASTCKTRGTMGYYHCDTCGKDVAEKTATAPALTADAKKLSLDPTNHEGGTKLVNFVDATCTKDGYSGDVVCVGCGLTMGRGTAIAAGHELVKVEAAAATHEKEGNIAHYACAKCEGLYEDDKATKALTAQQAYIAKIAHEYKTETDANNHWTVCECGSKTEAEAHTFKQIKHDAEGHWKVCDCGYTQAAEKHTFTAKYAAEGHTNVCDCGYKQETTDHVYTLQSNESGHWNQCFCGQKQEADKHIFGKWTTVKKATLEEEGLREKACKDCGYKQSEKIEVLSTSPITGDISPVVLWIALAAVSAGAVFALIAISKKKLNVQN